MLKMIADALGPVELRHFSQPLPFENLAECELEYPSGETSLPMLSVAGAYDESIPPKVVARGHLHCMAEGSASPFVLMPEIPHDYRLLPRTIEAVDSVIRDFVSSHVVLGPH